MDRQNYNNSTRDISPWTGPSQAQADFRREETNRSVQQPWNPGYTSNTMDPVRDREPPQSPRAKTGGRRLSSKLHKIADWVSTSEPSSQALRRHKTETFEKAGIPLSDSRDRARASAKLHAPLGQIPGDAIKTVGGPSPEDLLLKRNQHAPLSPGGGDGQRRQNRKMSTSASLKSQSSSGLSTASVSSNNASPTCSSATSASPWENLKFETTWGN